MKCSPGIQRNHPSPPPSVPASLTLPATNTIPHAATGHTAMWEKRYNKQVSATEKALLAKRNVEISLREAGRVLEEVRAEATRAAQEAAATLVEATKLSSVADRTAKDSKERRRGEGTEDDSNRWELPRLHYDDYPQREATDSGVATTV